jgi:glycolate oxidase FAD binding subunit
MARTLKPRDESDIVEAIAGVVSSGKTCDVVGHGTKSGIGRRVNADCTLDMSKHSGVVFYEPEELVLSAKAGTPMKDIEKMLIAHRQEFAFEPMDTGPLFGHVAGKGTLGGMLSINFSGPRRVKAGASRDHALGVRAISGRGEAFKAGGRVVKNVTGYDLPKLMAGSYGTLAVMSELTFKVLPVAESSETLLIIGLPDASALKVMAAAMGSAHDVSGAAHAPDGLADRLTLKTKSAVTALRLEGIAQSIAYRRTKLEAMFKSLGMLVILKEPESRRFWSEVRDVRPFTTHLGNSLWRLSVAPSEGARIGETIAAATGARILYDWAGGLLWAEMPDRHPQEVVVRGAVRGHGFAILVRVDPSVRDSASAFGEPEANLLRVMKSLKQGFDPQAVLNRGRMYVGL